MKESSSITVLQDARPEDAGQAASLILAAGPALFRLLFGPGEADVVRFFAALFRRGRNPFSYENAVVAERDGRVVGLAICADAAARRRIGRRMFWLVPRLRGPWAVLRRLRDVLDVMGGTSVPPAGAYYLSILAVVPEARGRGVGTLLLAEVERRARASGAACLALHTEIDNEAAQRLYARQGYVETHRKATPRAARWGVAGFVMMVCPLE